MAERIEIEAARATHEATDGGDPFLPDAPARELLISRRRFVAGSVALLGAGATLTLAACNTEPPGPPASPNAWVPVSIAGLETGVPRWVEFEAPDTTTGTTAAAATPQGTPADSIPQRHGAAWLVKEADGTVVAFYPLCTHQYCIYDWETGQTRFHCRCHEGFFSVEGTVLGGPPKKPLYRWLTRPAGLDTIEIGVLVKT